MFESQVLPVVTRYARRAFGRDDEKVAIAECLSWYYWQGRTQELPPSVWAVAAVRAVRNKRDLPGIRSNYTDVWDRAVNWQGAGMGQVADRRPGPEAVVMHAEEYEVLKAGLNDTQRALVELVEQDQSIRGIDLAARLGKSPGRITQLRLEIKALYQP